MKHSMTIRRLALAVGCAVVLAALGSAKHPVTRPFKVHKGTVTLVLQLDTGMFTVLDTGEATHQGQYINRGVGQMDQNGVIIWAEVTATGAGGNSLDGEIHPGAPDIVVFTGGTGRFENITGGFVMVSSPAVVTPGPDPGTAIVTFTYTGEGTITY